MFDTSSRYANIETASYTAPDGRKIAYKRRRFLPNPDMPLLAETGLQDGERLDNFTSRTLGNPEHYWRIADANRAMNPEELTEEAGRLLKVPVPQF